MMFMKVIKKVLGSTKDFLMEKSAEYPAAKTYLISGAIAWVLVGGLAAFTLVSGMLIGQFYMK